jgi:catechol 2,3-dioxygenase-like lactoylglutathione lyase family enzyme
VITLKRTTFIVPDAVTMASFYADVLGWRRDYEAPLTLSGGIIPGAQPGDQVRLVIMGGLDPEIGKIGLLEWTAPRLPSAPRRERLGLGDLAVVADVDDIHALAARLVRRTDVQILTPPLDWAFGDIQLTSMNFFDPAGILHEVYYRHNRPNPDGYLIRRVTTIVPDAGRAAGFYTDALGLTVHQDGTVKNEGMIFPAGAAGDSMRLVVCRGAHAYIGMVGALQFVAPPLGGDLPAWQLRPGKAVMVAGTEDAAAVFARVAAYGATITRPPFARTVPRSGGAGETAMTSLGFIDPAGLVWEVNQRT